MNKRDNNKNDATIHPYDDANLISKYLYWYYFTISYYKINFNQTYFFDKVVKRFIQNWIIKANY